MFDYIYSTMYWEKKNDNIRNVQQMLKIKTKLKNNIILYMRMNMHKSIWNTLRLRRKA